MVVPEHYVVNDEDRVGACSWDVVAKISWLVKAGGFHGVLKHAGCSGYPQMAVNTAVRG